MGVGCKRLYFPFEILPGLPIENKISKVCCMFLILNKYSASALMQNKVKVLRQQNYLLFNECKPASSKLDFCHNTDEMATLK